MPTLSELSAAVWGLASVTALAETGVAERLAQPRTAEELAEAAQLEPRLVAALLDVLVSLGLAEHSGGRYRATGEWAAQPDALRADLRTTLLQATNLAQRARSGELVTGWSETDETVLQAQGDMSARAVDMLEHRLFPAVPGMLDRLRSGSGAFLDVGTGVGAVAVEMCRRFPVTAVGLEPQSAPLALARRNVQEAGLADRIELRPQLVQDLPDEDAFDVAWLPGSFLPTQLYEVAVERVHRALRPGGLILLGTLGGDEDDLEATAARLRSVLWGGDVLAPDTIVRMLESTGFTDITLPPRLPSRLQPIFARKPA